MVRHEKWPIFLSDYIEEKIEEPFKWGVNDCLLFAGVCVERLTGIDFHSQYRNYDDECGAYKIINDNGGVVNLISKHLGNYHRNYKKAGRGDVVVFKNPELTCGIVDDTCCNIVCVAKTGIIRIPVSSAIYIWSY